jgi:hypothetical protein
MDPVEFLEVLRKFLHCEMHCSVVLYIFKNLKGSADNWSNFPERTRTAYLSQNRKIWRRELELVIVVPLHSNSNSMK